ncbi:MAG: TRAP transporter substrate-binding protein [Myxococcales bacterium]|nr:TRAP transporter substrate-binding protein [Myxococcales bacterium]
MLRQAFLGLFAAFVGLSCAGLLAPGEARADEAGQIVVKLGTAAPDDTPWAKQLQRLKKRFEAESKGKVKLKIFLGSVKGGEDAMARQGAQGALQMVGLTTAALAILAPELDVLELPYRFASQAEADRVLDDPEVWAMITTILEKKGLTPYIWSENGWRNYATKAKEVHTPGDLKGLKMRAQENHVHIETYKALAASPVPISVPETLSALQTGVVDGFDNTPLYAFAASWYQSVKFWSVSDHIYQPALVCYNKAWLDGLPADIKALLLSNRTDETAYGRGLIRKINEPLLKNLGEAGVKVTRLTPEEKAVFAKTTKPVHAKIRGEQSKEGKALFDLIEKKIAAK